MKAAPEQIERISDQLAAIAHDCYQPKTLLAVLETNDDFVRQLDFDQRARLLQWICGQVDGWMGSDGKLRLSLVEGDDGKGVEIKLYDDDPK